MGGPSIPITTRDRDLDAATAGAGQLNPPPPTDPVAVHGWLLEQIADGERVNRADPAWEKADKLQDFVMGEQPTGDHPSYMDRMVVNQTKKAIGSHVSVLTDLEPLWEYRTENANLKRHADIYNDLLLSWWTRCFADMDLADGIRYSATIGAGDFVMEWDPGYNGAGDVRMFARDWRDTLPIGASRTRSIQDWEGVIFKEQHPAKRLLRVYPGKARYISESRGVLSNVFSKFRGIIHGRAAVPITTLSGLGSRDPNRKYSAQSVMPEVIVFRCFVRDGTRNMTPMTVLMGPPGAPWGYAVEPGGLLYPRGRCIVATEQGILWDGPNPYISGRWPGARLRLQPWPWLFVGMPIANDLMPIGAKINEIINDLSQALSQWVNRGSIWGKNAPDNMFKSFDPRKKNWKIKVNQVVGTGFQLQDGPAIPPWALQYLDKLFAKFDEMAGTANLQQLLQLRQSPGAETIEKYLEAMTPEIRLEGRQEEACLRELADLFLSMSIQFYSTERRMMILGERGQDLADLDYDPGTLIPAMAPGAAGYIEAFDKDKSRDQRAKYYLQQFGFHVAPNSILAMHAQTRKMLYLQLSRQGYMDVWTLMEALGVPNYGQPPAIPLPAQLQPGQKLAPGQQPPMELRVPQTVTERLMAQQQMNIGQTVSAAGRKASGQQPPKLEQKSDGSTTVSESG